MLTVLIVSASGSTETSFPVAASIEVLHSAGLEDALETLGRNRRIDAVLLRAGKENVAIAAAIREDNPAPPPLFAAGPDCPPGARVLPQGPLSDSVEHLLREIS